jgi:hypothetical protein
MLAGDRKMVRHLRQMAGNEIVRIFDQFILRDGVDSSGNRVGAQDIKQQTAYAFDQGMRTLEPDPNLENMMDTALINRLQNAPRGQPRNQTTDASRTRPQVNESVQPN